jgi:hypothetical protein
MSIQTFRTKVFRHLKAPHQKLSKVSVELWLKMRDGTFALLDREQDERNLNWWGLENGSEVYVYFDTKI